MVTAKEGLEQAQYIKVLEIINALNASHRQGHEVYCDCGELGVAHIWWEGRWRWSWIEISKEFLPEET